MKKSVIALALTLFAGSVYLLGWSSLLTVKSIEVVGAPNQITEMKVVGLSKIEVGEQLARVDVRAIRARLQPLGWIDQVDVQRHWLSHHVTIALTARTPIARINQRYLAEDGATFDLPGGFNGEIPTVFAATQKEAIAAARLFTELAPDFRQKISLMKATGSGFTIMVTSNKRQIEIRWGADAQNSLKREVLDALLARPENRTVTIVDVSEPYAPIVK